MGLSKKLKGLGHFQTQYQNTEGLLLQFWQQLEKLTENEFIQTDINVEQQAAQDQNTISLLLTAPPFIPEIFEGRESDLEAVHQKLFAGEQLLLLVNGEGGIGKTTLAAKYWQRYQDECRHMAWVFAQSGLADALLTLALPLQVKFPADMAAKERLNHLLAAMANLDKPCLLVIDNANDRDDLENNYPALRTCNNFKLLLTTRVTQFEQAQTYRIEALNEADALLVFTKHYAKHRPEQDDLFRSIHKTVAGNTLVLELLARNLAAINTDEVFYSLAVLPAENLPYTMLKTLLTPADAKQFSSTLTNLAQRGWLEKAQQNNESVYKISPVVQEITRHKNQAKLWTHCTTLIENLIEKLDYQFGTGHFINASYDEAARYCRYAESISACFPGPNNILALLYDRMGSYHRTTGNLLQALQSYEKLNQLELAIYNADPNNVIFNDLAISCQNLGNISSVRQFYQSGYIAV